MKLKKQFNKKIIYSVNSDKVFKICNNEITNYLHFLIYKKESLEQFYIEYQYIYQFLKG